jgi:hypothetical protein
MRLIRPRFTIRQSMILVGLTALLLVAGRWAVAKVRLDSAIANYERGRIYYEEGRILGGEMIERSKRLLEARFEWVGNNKKARIQAIENHLARAEAIVKQARQDIIEAPNCRGGSPARIEAIEAEQARDEARALLARELP